MNKSVGGRIEQMNTPNAAFGFSPDTRVMSGMDAAAATAITRALREFPDPKVNAMGYGFHLAEGQTRVDRRTMIFDADTYAELAELAGVPFGSNILLNVELAADSNGRFIQRNPYTFEAGERVSFEGMADGIELHGQITHLPNHLLHLPEDVMTVIIPDGDISAFVWTANTNDVEGFSEYATAVFHEHYTLRDNETFIFQDMTTGFFMVTALVDIISVFFGIFSVMLALLGLTNVISTIVTSVQMRSREFAALASAGMDRKGLRNMLGFESLLSSARALMFGLPLGFIMAYIIYLGIEPSNPVSITFTAPWMAMAVCAVSVFAVTFLIMQVSAVGIGKNNIIETLRGAE
jgi:putative ABC transport system permease protein